MPVKSVVDKDAGVIFFTVTGPLTQADMRSALDGVYSDVEGDLPSSYLWDLREAEIDWSGEMVKAFVNWVRDRCPARRYR